MTLIRNMLGYVIMGFVILLTSAGQAPEGRHLDFIRVLDSCIPPKAPLIESLTDDFLQTMFKMMSSKDVFLATLDRLKGRLANWTNSDKLAEWYYSHTFDSLFAESWKSSVPITFYTDWDCFTLVQSTRNQLYECLESAVSGIALVRDRYIAVNTSENLKKELCRSTFQNCGRMSSAWLETCSDEIKRTINVFMNVIAGYDCYVNVIEPSTVEPDGDSNRTLLNQALSYCANHYFPRTDLTMMFPPSEASLPYIQQGYTVRDQRRLLEEFCKVNMQFSLCVTDNLRKPRLWEDSQLRKFINVDKFMGVVRLFCDNRIFITTQFDCIVSSLSQWPCHGGFNDIMDMYSKQILTNMSFSHICSNIQSAIECRVTKQLSQCGAEYAQLMDRLYSDLLSDDCHKGWLKLDILPCLFGYTDSLRTRYRDLSDPELLYNELELLCRTYKNNILTCIESKIADLSTLNSTNSDVTLDVETIISNIKQLADYSCTRLQSIKAHLVCATNALQKSSDAQACVNNLTDILWNTVYTFTGQGMPNPFCRSLNDNWVCLQNVWKSCDGAFNTYTSTVAEASIGLCSNPSKPIRFPSSGSERTSLSVFGILFCIVSAASIP